LKKRNSDSNFKGSKTDEIAAKIEKPKDKNDSKSDKSKAVELAAVELAISKEKALREREETATAHLDSRSELRHSKIEDFGRRDSLLFEKDPSDLYETIIETAEGQASALEALVAGAPEGQESERKKSGNNIYATESEVYESYSKYPGAAEAAGEGDRARELTATEKLIEKGTATYQASQRAGEDE